MEKMYREMVARGKHKLMKNVIDIYGWFPVFLLATYLLLWLPYAVPAENQPSESVTSDTTESRVMELIKSLGNEDRYKRRWAIDDLKKIETAAIKAVPALIDRLNDEDPLNRLSAAKALATIAPSSPSIALEIAGLLTDASHSVRRDALLSLAQMKETAHLVLKDIDRCRKDENMRVRLCAEYAWLSLLPEERSEDFDLTPVLKALKSQDEQTRQFAARVLGWLAPRSRESIPYLIVALDDENRTVRVQAAVALGCFGPMAEAALPRMKEVLYEVNHWEGRDKWDLWEVIFAIDRVKSPTCSSLDQSLDNEIIEILERD